MSSDNSIAAAELTAIFEALEVPIVCRDDPNKGKHLIATKPLPANTALFEEIPIVSWCFASRKDRFCDYCLASLAPPLSEGAAAATNNNATAKAPHTILPCPSTESIPCPAIYCSEECIAAAKPQHAFLCGAPLVAVRKFDQQFYHDRCVRPLEAAQARAASADGEGKDDDDDDEPFEELPVTLEAFARSVSSIANRYLTIAAAHPDATPQQLFPLAATLFDRLVAVPDAADYSADMDTKVWFKALRSIMCPRLEQLLLQAASSSGSGNASALSKSSARKEKVKQILDALVGDATLTTMLGQLSLNSQALNLPVYAAPSTDGADQEEDSDEVISDDDNDDVAKKQNKNARDKDDAHDDAKQNSGDEEKKPKKKKTRFEKQLARPTVAAGVFALHSALNHSCDPNAMVVPTGKNHEITVRLRRAVQQGEELCITYISNLYLKLEDFQKRRERLRPSYLFTCVCPVCLREEAAAAEKEGKEKQKDNKNDDDAASD